MTAAEIMGVAFALALVAALILTILYCDAREENDELRLKLIAERARNKKLVGDWTSYLRGDS